MKAKPECSVNNKIMMTTSQLMHTVKYNCCVHWSLTTSCMLMTATKRDFCNVISAMFLVIREREMGRPIPTEVIKLVQFTGRQQI